MAEKTNGKNGNGKPTPDPTPDPTPEKDDPVRTLFAGIAWQREIGDETPRVAVNEVQKPFTLITDEIEHPTAIALPEGFVLYRCRNPSRSSNVCCRCRAAAKASSRPVM